LGWIDAYTCKFNLPGSSLKVPHMGWNEVEEVKEHALTAQLPAEKRFYFVHSYYVKCNDKNDELLTTNYGLNFTSALQHNNIMGVQFHPEKSHRFGMQVFKNYVAL
jgi:glutamine amidotransferase